MSSVSSKSECPVANVNIQDLISLKNLKHSRVSEKTSKLFNWIFLMGWFLWGNSQILQRIFCSLTPLSLNFTTPRCYFSHDGNFSWRTQVLSSLLFLQPFPYFSLSFHQGNSYHVTMNREGDALASAAKWECSFYLQCPMSLYAPFRMFNFLNGLNITSWANQKESRKWRTGSLLSCQTFRSNEISSVIFMKER